MTRAIEFIQFSFNSSSNLPPNLHSALEGPSRDKPIIFKSADKGSNTVVINSVDYKNMCLKILNPDWYRPIAPAKFDRFNSTFYTLIQKGREKGLISLQTFEFIHNRYPKIPVLCFA